MTQLDSVLEQYLRTYRELISVEQIDDNSVSFSFPFHFASNHRIEVVVTHVSKDIYIISDSARIITELIASGYRVTKQLREKLETISKISGLRLIRDYLIMDSTRATLGGDIQRFLEAAKTIGDVYFVHKEKGINEQEIVAKVKKILDAEKVVYQEKFDVRGEIEPHKFAFYVPPNGSKALAIAVLGTQNTHNAAQVWAFKTEDVKRQPVNKGLRVGIVYDTTQPWSEESRRILQSRADIVLADDRIEEITPKLHEANV
jgi:hypothetical protein